MSSLVMNSSSYAPDNKMPQADVVPSRKLSPTGSPVPRVARPTVYVTRRIPQKGIETLLKACDVKQWDSELAVPRGELLHSVVSADGILCMPCDSIDVDVIDAAGPSLRVIATVSCDTDHIDVAECQRRGIEVITIPAQPDDNFAELTVTLMLRTIKEMLTEEERLCNFEPQAPDLITSNCIGSGWTNSRSRPCLLRRMSEESMGLQLSNGKITNTNCLTWRNVAKKTVGVYGLTKLGLGVVKLLKTFGVHEVLVADRGAELDNSEFVDKSQLDYDIVSFHELLKRSEVICVCGSVSEQPEIVFCRDSFQRMSKNAILVISNSQETAIDYIDLYAALRDGEIRAAGLNDCNQAEVPFKTPLLGLQNCVFLPQSEESVYDLRHKVSDLIAKNLIETLKTNSGKMKRIVE